MTTEERFHSLLNRMHVTDERVIQRWHKHLVQAYGENHRHYHTMSHVLDMLKTLDESKENLEHADDVELAIWFHDAVYVPHRNDNECASAALFCHFANDAHLVKMGDQHVDLVHTMIMATIDHETRSSSDPTAKQSIVFFLDCDLKILCSPPKEYVKYSTGIRREYGHLDDSVYAAARVRVLRGLLSRQKLFHSGIGDEALARANMEEEAASL